MKVEIWKKILPWIIAVIVFYVITLAYFNPLLQGKSLRQSDIIHFKGVSKEIADYRAQYGKEPLWTNSLFGGMPAFQISTVYPSNLTTYFDKILLAGLPHPANLVFLYALGFFILLMVLGVNPWLAIAGAIGFSFSSYFFIILEAGHNSKAHAIGLMAPVIAGILLTYRGKYLMGGVLTALFLSLELAANHLQITYYLLITVLILSLAEFAMFVREKKLPDFFKAAAVLVIAALFAIGPNISNLWTTYEYSKYTIRGKSDLTSNKENQTTGLDKDYATAWSYGVDETFTLLIPDFKGGSSNGSLSRRSEMYKVLSTNQAPNPDQIIKNIPLYWGPQPFTSGPVYVGAIFVFLFVLGLFLVKGPYKWGLLAATVVSVVLSWGDHFPMVTNFFLDYVPGYNKFRAVSMILVIAELTIPLLGILGLQKLFSGEIDRKKAFRALKITLIITGGITLLFSLLPGAFFNFVSPGDAQLKSSGYPDWFINALVADRETLLRNDAIRSLLFILLGAALVWSVIFEKLKKQYATIALILLVIIDMWAVNSRYLNNDSYVRKSEMQNPYEATPADEFILKDKDPDFRVLNLTVNTFNDASTSYFHKSIGGYHGAKLRRYQELIENQISKNNMAVLDMMNTKYFIMKGENNQPSVQPNMNALGNAWFVEQYKLVANADSEIVALTGFDPAKTAIVDKRFEQEIKGFAPGRDSLAGIKLTQYKPDYLIYESMNSKAGLAVFSEIYYDKGWNAFIDGKPAPYFRANYVLRAMIIPAGKHKIEFRFEPRSYYVGEKIALSSSILLIILVVGMILYELSAWFRKKTPVVKK
ncbi:MAG: YfhO family protein [Bacteroidetes bacterium]|nr:YfhO family protein [Bacteroidota bacterium]